MPRQMKITAVIRSPRIARRNIVWWARILFAVAVASPRTISLLGIYSRVNGAVNTIDKYTAPAMRAAFLVGCMRASPFSFWKSVESERSAITPQPDCCSDECDSERQADPELRCAEIFSRRERHGANPAHAEGKRFGGDCEQRQHRPKKCRAPRHA